MYVNTPALDLLLSHTLFRFRFRPVEPVGPLQGVGKGEVALRPATGCGLVVLMPPAAWMSTSSVWLIGTELTACCWYPKTGTTSQTWQIAPLESILKSTLLFGDIV